MKTKTLVAICIFSLLTVNLTYARWPQIDPLAENYYPQSPYSFTGNNPVNYVDPNGMNYITTKYFSENGDFIVNTDDNYPDRIVIVPNDQLSEFLRHLQLTEEEILNSDGWNNYWTGTFGEYTLTLEEQAVINMYHSEKSPQ